MLGKPTIYIGENKGADQLRSNCEADLRLCFRYRNSTIAFFLDPGRIVIWMMNDIDMDSQWAMCFEFMSQVFTG